MFASEMKLLHKMVSLVRSVMLNLNFYLVRSLLTNSTTIHNLKMFHLSRTYENTEISTDQAKKPH